MPKEAASCASGGLALFNELYVDGYALCTLHLGAARLQIGEIDEVTQIIGDAAVLAARNRQPRLVKELRTARERLRPWCNATAVKELDGGLRGLKLW